MVKEMEPERVVILQVLGHKIGICGNLSSSHLAYSD